MTGAGDTLCQPLILCSEGFACDLQKRDMDSTEILTAIKDTRKDVAWKYLTYLVQERSSMLPEHHTELAILLVEHVTAMLAKPNVE